MRAEMLGVTIVAALLFHGSPPDLNGALTREKVAVPAWLAIPANADVAEINYTGGPGDENTRGRIRILTNGDAPQVVSAMMTHLALDGFVIGEKHFDQVLSSQVRALVTAENPETGMSATVAFMPGMLTEELHINFAETATQ